MDDAMYQDIISQCLVGFYNEWPKFESLGVDKKKARAIFFAGFFSGIIDSQKRVDCLLKDLIDGKIH